MGNWSNRNYVLKAVKEDGFNIQFADPKFLSDRKLALVAVQSFGWAISHLSEDLKNDKEIVLTAIKNEGDWCRKDSILREVSWELRHDSEVVEAALESNDRAILWAYPPKDEWNDENYVLPLVTHNPHYLAKIGSKLYDNVKIALIGVDNNRHVARYIKNKNVALAVVSKYPTVYNELNTELQKDEDICNMVVKQNGRMLSEIPYPHKNKKLTLEAVKQDGMALQYAYEYLRNDYEVVYTAMQNNIEVFEFAGDKLLEEIVIPNLIMDKLKEKINEGNK